MPQELPKTYDPQEVEALTYQRWEQSGFFNPDNLPFPADAPTYTIILPPPNITAKLHLGHSSMLAIEDLLIRFHRMNGFRTLWVPGTDHAAIATQNVVEKQLWQITRKTRHDLGKEKFLDEVWKFLKQTQSTILAQTKRMGASMDWSREAFTLDEPRKQAVTKMFVDMFQEGIISRGERIVNWCPRCQSTLADDEVEYEPQQAVLYTFKYSSDFPFAIATTRPETKLGDTAVAVNPKDPRYQKYIGQSFSITFCGIPLTLKIIADRHVDPKFGTGALGVTPAHSMADWKMAEEQQLPIVKVINETGTISTDSRFGMFSGKSIAEARALVVAELQKQNLIENEEALENNLSVCYRCGTAIEPLPSKQWFVNVNKSIPRLGHKSLKEKSIEVAQQGKIQFVPERFTKRYLDWMDNLHDWCISRQIWFGHEIPVWYRGEEVYCGEHAPDGSGWIQDPDSLDTWFSSGMWTFSTLGWPDNLQNGEKTGDLKRFHPTQVLETGYEIITLWVSRMIMMSLFALDEIPFEHVYLHGMVLDAQGKKMSKSKGNGIDPVVMIDKYGTDAVRLSLLLGNTPGNDMRLGEEKIESFRNFVNKLWNIGRYVEHASQANRETAENSLADNWILEKFEELKSAVTADIKKFQFSQAGERLREFTWNEFADWYVEIHKIEQNGRILNYIFENLLKLWHPFAPFVTEVLYQKLYATSTHTLLMIAPWPTAKPSLNRKHYRDFETLVQFVVQIRNVRATYRIDPQLPVAIITSAKLLLNQSAVVCRLARVSEITLLTKDNIPQNTAPIIIGNLKAYILLEGIIDFVKERERLTKELQQLEQYAAGLKKRLGNRAFAERAPAEIVEKERANLASALTKIEQTRQHLTVIQ